MSDDIDDELLRANLPRLVAFARVVERGSRTRAAADLGVTRPAMSQTLRALEEALGVRLLQRSTRAARPTQAGERLYEVSHELLQMARRAIGDARQERDRPTGTLRIACASGLVARAVVVPALARVARTHTLDVEVRVSDHKVSLVDSGVDVGVRLGIPFEEGLVVRKFLDVPQVLLAAPCAGVSLRTAEDLGSMPWIVHSAQPLRIELSRGDERVTVRRRPRHLVDSAEIALELLLAGLGVACLPRLYAVDSLRTGALVQLLPGWRIYDVKLYAALASRDHLPARTRVFLDALEQVVLEMSTDAPEGRPSSGELASRPPRRAR